MEEDFLKDLFCHQCQLQFNGKAVYNLHLSLVHKHDSDIKNEENQRKSSFEYDKCDEKFGITDKLNDVTTVHGGKKAFECTQSLIETLGSMVIFDENQAVSDISKYEFLYPTYAKIINFLVI